MASDGSDNAAPVSEAGLAMSADEVAAFLRDNPNYLVENPDLLQVLTPPQRWTGDGVVDMQGFILDRLRKETENLKSSANELVATTRSNLLVQTRTHAAVLAILGADSYDKLVHVTVFDLPLLLDVDAVALCFEAAAESPALAAPDARAIQAGAVGRLLGSAEDVALLDDTSDNGTVFGAAAGLVRSAALVRLHGGAGVPMGMMALGARGVSTFHPNQATELLTFLARVLETCLHRWLATPR
jgi:hypothetical protein